MAATNPPLISVLIAARNEESNMKACLEGVLRQTFPSDRYEVWIGDDNSSDGTAAVVKQFQASCKNLHLLPVEKNLNGLLGKANVLAQLARVARGEILLITDADVQVPPGWIDCYARHFRRRVDMISGVVALNGQSVFAKLQNADWLTYMAECNEKSNKGQPVTAVGCNMAIRSSTYKAVGGYEKIPFSVTEDYELFRAVTSAGYAFGSLMDREALAFTNPVKTFGDLLKQRRRWLTGSFSANWRFVLGFNLNCLFLPFLLALAFLVNPLIPATLFLYAWVNHIIFLRKVYHKLELKKNAGLYLYKPYSMICNVIFMFVRMMPTPVEWKGRKYGQ